MNDNTVKAFRQQVYACFVKGQDSLLNLVDALASEDRAQSLPELSLSVHFLRKHASIYKALKQGRLDERALRQVLWKYLPACSGRPILAADCSSIARPKSRTSRDRSAQLVHNLPSKSKVTVAGWQFSTLIAVPEQPGGWTYVLDQRRVPTESTPAQILVKQLREMSNRGNVLPLVLLDRGYDAAWLWCQLSALPLYGALIRLKSNRLFYRPAPAPTGLRGAPRKRGAKWQPKDPATQSDPSGEAERRDVLGKVVRVRYWRDLRLKEADWLPLTVIRVERPAALGTERDPRLSWFVWIGDQQADPAEVALAYVLRFSQEHGYRFDKQELLWEQARLQTPEQFALWSWIVALAHNLLVLSRDLVTPELRPWENRQRPATLQQVRRGMNKFLAQLGTPARPPQPRGKSKGRAKGAKMPKRERFRVVQMKQKVPLPTPP
jgi:hypothetical protein